MGYSGETNDINFSSGTTAFYGFAFCGESKPSFANWVTFWMKVDDSRPNGRSTPNKSLALFTMRTSYAFFSIGSVYGIGVSALA